MGFNFDINAVTPVLKNRYTQEKIQSLTFKSALLAIFPKDTDQGGVQYVGAIRSAVGSTASHSDSTAYTSGSSSVYNQWLCPWSYGFASANVSGSAIDLSKGDPNALVDAMVSEFDGAFIDLGQMLGADLFGNGGGAFGQLASTSTIASTTITLRDPSKVFNFSQGQILQASADDGTGGGGVRAGTVTLTAVDITTGNLTASGNWNAGIAAITVNDFLFQNGNYNGAYPGLAGWLPDSTHRGSLGTAFCGVVRSADPVRLAGVYYTGLGAPKTETIMKAAALVQRMNGRPDFLVVNPLDYADIEITLSSQKRFVTVEAFENAQISFDGVSIATAYGMITILMDIYCPVGTAYLLELDTWLMPSAGEVPRVAGEGVDGLQWLRASGSENYQMRCKYIASTYCSAPGKNCVITW
jgi:hypothetical protein